DERGGVAPRGGARPRGPHAPRQPGARLLLRGDRAAHEHPPDDDRARGHEVPGADDPQGALPVLPHGVPRAPGGHDAGHGH
ncbi:unnamed protein product, partial [Heterosigma akashiwo]